MTRKQLQILLPVVILTVIAEIGFLKHRDRKFTAVDLGTPLEITRVDMGEIKAGGLPVIICFGSGSCIPCRQMAPVLEKLHAEMQGKAGIHYLDVVKNPDAIKGLPVQVIPTQVFFTADGRPYIPGLDLNIPLVKYSVKDTKEHAFTIHEGGLTEEQMRAILADMGVTE